MPDLVNCLLCGGSGNVLVAFDAFTPSGVKRCGGCGGSGKVLPVVQLTASADPRPYEPPKVTDLGTVEDVVRENLELKKQLRRLAEFANVHRSIKDDTTPDEIATWVEQAVTGDLTELRKQVHGPQFDLSEQNRRLCAQIDELDAVVRDAADMDPSHPIEDAVKCVRETIEQNEQLKKQVDDLQADNTRLVDERRAVDERYMVEHFHRLMPQPVLDTPQVPTEERVRLRANLIAEEFLELLEALFEFSNNPPIEELREMFFEFIRYAPVQTSLSEFADACADLKYVIVGAELEFGIDGRPIFLGVHEANLRKVGGPKRADGKGLKPEGWQPFDVAAELRRQGWRGR